MRVASTAALNTALALLLMIPAGVQAPAGAATTFSATASGDLVRAGLKLTPGLLTEQLLDPGALAAQASLDSLGTSAAFASNPFPGSLPIELPGIVGGLTAGAVDLPEYPLFASSHHPTRPDSRIAIGALVLNAASREYEATASAEDGANRTTAEVRLDPATDAVTASAVTTVGDIAVADVLTVAGVRSGATVVRHPDGTLDRTTSFEVASVNIFGQSLALTPNGLTLLGHEILLGIDAAAVVASLLGGLEQLGIHLTVLPAAEIEDGVISAALLVEFPIAVPNYGTALVTASVGRTTASATNRVRSSPPGTAGVGAVDGPSPPGDLGVPRTVGPLEINERDPGPGRAVTPPAQDLPDARPARVTPDPSVTPDRSDLGSFYPVLVLVAALMSAAAAIFRNLGVKLRWT